MKTGMVELKVCRGRSWSLIDAVDEEAGDGAAGTSGRLGVVELRAPCSLLLLLLLDSRSGNGEGWMHDAVVCDELGVGDELNAAVPKLLRGMDCLS